MKKIFLLLSLNLPLFLGAMELPKEELPKEIGKKRVLFNADNEIARFTSLIYRSINTQEEFNSISLRLEQIVDNLFEQKNVEYNQQLERIIKKITEKNLVVDPKILDKIKELKAMAEAKKIEEKEQDRLKRVRIDQEEEKKEPKDKESKESLDSDQSDLLNQLEELQNNGRFFPRDPKKKFYLSDIQAFCQEFKDLYELYGDVKITEEIGKKFTDILTSFQESLLERFDSGKYNSIDEFNKAKKIIEKSINELWALFTKQETGNFVLDIVIDQKTEEQDGALAKKIQEEEDRLLAKELQDKKEQENSDEALARALASE